MTHRDKRGGVVRLAMELGPGLWMGKVEGREDIRWVDFTRQAAMDGAERMASRIRPGTRPEKLNRLHALKAAGARKRDRGGDTQP